LLLRRSATGPARPGRPAPPPRRQARHQQPGHLAHPEQQLHAIRGTKQPARSCAARSSASKSLPSRSSADPHPPTQGAVAVVARPRPSRSGAAVAGLQAGLHPPGRPGAHPAVCQADPGLDHWAGPLRGCVPPSRPDRWTWLVVAAYTQLRLARAGATDQRLPWERPRPPGRLSPLRVRRGFPKLLLRVGTPANAPKPCARSPGRPTDSRSGPAPRHPAIETPLDQHKQLNHKRRGRVVVHCLSPEFRRLATDATGDVRSQYSRGQWMRRPGEWIGHLSNCHSGYKSEG